MLMNTAAPGLPGKPASITAAGGATLINFIVALV